MTNVKLLKKKIDASGLKINYIAECIGISRQLLWKKINNLKLFDQYEIAKLCHILNIDSKDEKEAIFFAKNVD